MGCTKDERTLLIYHRPPPPALKFPLSLVAKDVQPYLELMRLEKPTGMILMFWPFAWGLTMAAFRMNLPLSTYCMDLSTCLFEAFILRSSACTVNDIFDRDVDAGVERTKNRPLPSGRISLRAAIIFLIAQYIFGLGFFYMVIKGPAVWVAVFQLLPLFAIYPLLKRWTHWPQAWLGFAMNFGFITAWITTATTVNPILLACGIMSCWCWTMLYDTVYACQDIKDDIKLGVCSTAILFGSWIRPLLVACGLMFTLMLGLAGYVNEQGPCFYILSVGGSAVHLVWQYMTVDLNIPASCWSNFGRNGQLGWIVWGGLMIDYLACYAPKI